MSQPHDASRPAGGASWFEGVFARHPALVTMGLVAALVVGVDLAVMHLRGDLQPKAPGATRTGTPPEASAPPPEAPAAPDDDPMPALPPVPPPEGPEALRPLLAQAPMGVYANLTAGWRLLAAGHADQAQGRLLAAADAAPPGALRQEAYFRLAAAALEAGAPETADRALARYLAEAPEGEYAATATRLRAWIARRRAAP